MPRAGRSVCRLPISAPAIIESAIRGLHAGGQGFAFKPAVDEVHGGRGRLHDARAHRDQIGLAGQAHEVDKDALQGTQRGLQRQRTVEPQHVFGLRRQRAFTTQPARSTP